MSCFSSAGTRALVKVEEITQSSKYQSNLALNLKVSVRKQKLKKNFTFQHDKDQKHKSRSTKELLQKRILIVWNDLVRIQS